jgi:chromosomal replication initiation ATPase DnaA
MIRPRQLAFDLHFRAALGAEDFLVSATNSAAVEAVEEWPSWPQRTLALVGPAGSGKSHLVEVWRAGSGAARIAAVDLSDEAVAAATEPGAVAVEDIDKGIADERVLFHLFNLAREGRISLLLTSQALPGEMSIALPDLRSRLRAVALARIEKPDESLLRALLVKLLADRQQTVSPRIIEYVMRRMERSAEAAREFVRLLDQRALAKRSDLTLGVAREVMDEMNGPEPGAELQTGPEDEGR